MLPYQLFNGMNEWIFVVILFCPARSRGFGFIYFRDIDDACTAQRACLDGLELHGKMVRVDFSYTKGPHKPTPGVYMGRDKKR